MKRWQMILVIVFGIIAVLAVALWIFPESPAKSPEVVIVTATQAPILVPTSTNVPTAVPTQPQPPTPTNIPTAVVATTEPKLEDIKIEDIVVKHFRDVGQFFIDGDPQIQNWKVQGALMTYTCTTENGVFITMDPGVVNQVDTGKLGAVLYVECKKDDVVTLKTEFWSESALHQQVHLVELLQPVTDDKAIELLKILKVDEGKELAVYIDYQGLPTKY